MTSTVSPSSPLVLTPAKVERLRREAKRLGRIKNIQHAEALDRVAARNGFQNWSLLAKHAAEYAEANPAPAPTRTLPVEIDEADDWSAQEDGPGPREPLPRLRMDASRAEKALILAIVKRYENILGSAADVDRLSTLMDLEACHCNGCPVDLEALASAPRDVDVVHDVAGIGRHLNRDTGRLQDGFTPRYAAPEVHVSSEPSA